MLFNYRARKAEQVDMARAIMVAMIVSVGGFRYTTFIYICKMLPFDLTKTGTEKCLRKVVKANPELFNGCCDYVTRGSEFHTSVIKYTPELQAYVAKALVDFTTPRDPPMNWETVCDKFYSLVTKLAIGDNVEEQKEVLRLYNNLKLINNKRFTNEEYKTLSRNFGEGGFH